MWASPKEEASSNSQIEKVQKMLRCTWTVPQLMAIPSESPSFWCKKETEGLPNPKLTKMTQKCAVTEKGPHRVGVTET